MVRMRCDAHEVLSKVYDFRQGSVRCLGGRHGQADPTVAASASAVPTGPVMVYEALKPMSRRFEVPVRQQHRPDRRGRRRAASIQTTLFIVASGDFIIGDLTNARMARGGCGRRSPPVRST